MFVPFGVKQAAGHWRGSRERSGVASRRRLWSGSNEREERARGMVSGLLEENLCTILRYPDRSDLSALVKRRKETNERGIKRLGGEDGVEKENREPMTGATKYRLVRRQ
jgi:hypothetical protein